MKLLLHKNLGTQRLKCEEMITVLTEVEPVLNSRPLTPMDSAPLDGATVLTPGHFLVGRPLRALPEIPNTSNNMSSIKRWNLCQVLSQQLWEQWSQDYLRQLQRFHQWRQLQRSVRVGGVVLLKDNELFNRSWPLARVIEVHAGTDGLVRVVTLQKERGIYKRSIHRLVPLLQEDAAAIPPPEDVRVQDLKNHSDI